MFPEGLEIFECGEDREPVSLFLFWSSVFGVEGKLDVDVEDAGVVFRPFDVAAQPVEGVSDS